MRFHFFLRCALAGAMILPLAWSPAGAGETPGKISPEKIQKKRTITMKAINKSMRRIRVYAGKGELENVARAAGEVSRLVARIPALSPRGSAFGEKSRIKPGVWEDFGRYEELSDKSAAAARAMAATAQKGDRGALMKSFAALAKSCGACHKPFRKKKKKRQ
jgi:cytochrome c556